MLGRKGTFPVSFRLDVTGKSARFGRGRLTDLAAKNALQFAVLTLGGGGLPGGGEQAHDASVRLFVERVGSRRAPRVFESARRVAGLFAVTREPAKRLKIRCPQALALVRDPVLVIAGQQRTAVAIYRRAQVPGALGFVGRLPRVAHSRIERSHVRGERERV